MILQILMNNNLSKDVAIIIDKMLHREKYKDAMNNINNFDVSIGKKRSYGKIRFPVPTLTDHDYYFSNMYAYWYFKRCLTNPDDIDSLQGKIIFTN